MKRPGEGLDPEEARIYRQSIPAQEVTRDFLEDLLNEHRANEPACTAENAHNIDGDGTTASRRRANHRAP